MVIKVPLIRKIINLSAAKAICLPKSWLEFYEREAGVTIQEVAIEVDKVLTVMPIIPKKEEGGEGKDEQP